MYTRTHTFLSLCMSSAGMQLQNTLGVSFSDLHKVSSRDTVLVNCTSGNLMPTEPAPSKMIHDLKATEHEKTVYCI